MIYKVLLVAYAVVLVQANPIYNDYYLHGPSYLQSEQIIHTPHIIQSSPAIIHTHPVIHAAPIIKAPVYQPDHEIHAAKITGQTEEINPNPSYSYSYGVSDPTTGDQKQAQEELVDGVVKGSYSLVEPDGQTRKVTYQSDDVNGFTATVEKTGAPTPAVAVAPIAKYVSAPVHQYISPPIAKYVSAPVHHYINPPIAKYVSAPVHQYIGTPIAKYTVVPAKYTVAGPIAYTAGHFPW